MIFRETKPIVFKFEDLKWPFGFTRMAGEQILMMQIIFPSKSEETLQMDPPWKIHDNIQSWCRENWIMYQYDIGRDEYMFQLTLKRQQI